MQICLRRASSRLLFASMVLLFAAIFIFSVGKLWLADHYGHSSNPDNWERAAKLEPKNPEYWHQLGVYEEWDVERGNLNRAVDFLQRAVRIDPWSDTYWIDLASIYEALGKTKAATAAYRDAQWAHPASPGVAWRLGSFFLRQKDFRGASIEIRRALTQDPNLTVPALSQCLKTGQAVTSILNEVLPAQGDYYLTALDYFLSQKGTTAALEVWSRLLNLETPLKMTSSFSLIEALIHSGQITEAIQVWQQALRKSQDSVANPGNASVVFNGGFERDILNGGFDWRTSQIDGAAFQSDSSTAHEGTRSMSITFDGSFNLDFQHLVQFVPVEPDHLYHFSAFLRTDRITTDSGVGFVAFDPLHNNAPRASTPTLAGTHSWTLVETNILTSPATHLLEIALQRKQSLKFDNKLSGTVWVDDVTLVPIGNGKKTSSP